MKNICILFMIIFILSFFGCSKKEVGGEVFIVTKGQSNIKLGLVTVSFLTEKQYQEASDTNKIDYINAIKTYNKLDSIKHFEFCLEQISFYQKHVNSWEGFVKSYEGYLREYYTNKDRTEARTTLNELKETVKNIKKKSISM
jgi:hypothetical protein